MFYQNKPFTGQTLRWVAMVTMMVDHLGVVLLDQGLVGSIGYLVMRSVGRLSFPLFVFLMVEGVYHTRDRGQYLFRLLVLAVVSQPMFSYFGTGSWVNMDYWNAIFNLLVGALVLSLLDRGSESLLGRIGSIAGAITLTVLLEWSGVDYGGYGVVVAVLLATLRDVTHRPYQGSAWGVVGYHLLSPTSIQTLGLGSSFFILGYNGRKGQQNKWINYTFYPAHLLLLGLWRWW